MPDVWLPGVHRDPGQNAGYNSGRSQMIRAVAHYTVGQDSRSTGKNGYCHFVVHKDASRENGCTQYAEIDAVTWHAANAGNPYGPGIEWERMTTGGVNDEGLSNADPLTANQLEWGSRIVAFCADWGIPAVLYDGPRYEYGDWCGWINHHDIDSQRTDGLLRAEWDAITGGGPPPSPDVDWDEIRRRIAMGKIAIIRDTATAQVYAFDGMTREYLESNDRLQILIATGHITADEAAQPVDLMHQQVETLPER